jgi:hypothetical protein
MPTEYEQNDEIQTAIVDMLGQEGFADLNPIREHEVKILSALCIRTDKNGEDAECKGDPVTLKKVGAMEKLFVDADYIVVIDRTTWNTASEVKQHAIIHRGLSKIDIKVTKGAIMLGTKKPDIVEFSTTLGHFGAYNEPLLQARDAMLSISKNVAKKLQEKN